MASAYGELYERFCCHIGNIFSNNLINKNYKEYRKKTNLYIYHPDEIELNWNDIMNDPRYRSLRINYFLNACKDEDEAFFSAYDASINNTKVAIPYTNLSNTNNKKYFIPELIASVAKSDGMAAGNTLEEALVQGCSEIMERYVWN